MPAPRKPASQVVWHLAYETATISTHTTEDAAWLAHTIAVIKGLNPDALAVVKAVR